MSGKSVFFFNNHKRQNENVDLSICRLSMTALARSGPISSHLSHQVNGGLSLSVNMPEIERTINGAIYLSYLVLQHTLVYIVNSEGYGNFSGTRSPLVYLEHNPSIRAVFQIYLKWNCIHKTVRYTRFQ